jgi:hypothetical protein
MIWDELFQAEYGNQVLAWFSSGFSDRRALDYLDLYLYGGLFEAPAQWIATRSPLGLYETRHLLTGACALAGIVAAWLTAKRIAGTRAAFAAAAILACTPAWIGHGLFNSKDIPFGAAVGFVVYAAVRLATKSDAATWRDAVWSAVAVGVAVALRPGGIFVASYPWLGAVASMGISSSMLDAGRVHWRTVTISFSRLAVTLPLSWLIVLAGWPWAQVSPLMHPLEAITAASRFAWDGEMLFRGAMVRSTHLPAGYLPTWFAVTIPELHVLMLAAGALALGSSMIAMVGRKLSGPESTEGVAIESGGGLVVVATIAGPLIGVWWQQPVLYDGLRHFLFLFPSLAVLAGVGWSAFIDATIFPVWSRQLLTAATVLALLLVVHDIVALHPYQYVYFNRLSGGLQSAVGRYETDYWGASYKEGLAWVAANVSPPVPGRPLRVSSCNDNSNRRIDYYRRTWTGAADRLTIAPEYRDADVFLAVTRYDCHKQPGDVLHIVERQGAPLLYVIRTAPR